MRQVWYHANCWDGFGAAWAHRRIMGESERYVPVQYGQAPPPHSIDDNVYVLDFSYPGEIMLALKQEVAKLTVIDHHESAREAVEAVGGVFDQGMSGATLTWTTLGAPDNPPIPKLLLYVQDRDLWPWQIPDSRTLQWLIRSLRPDFEAWDRMAAAFESERHATLFARAASIREFVEAQIDEAAGHAWKLRIEGHDCLILNATILTSDICDRLISTGKTAVAGYFAVGADGRRRWGFRSKNGEALAICKARGGGGHANAAGYIEP